MRKLQDNSVIKFHSAFNSRRVKDALIFVFDNKYKSEGGSAFLLTMPDSNIGPQMEQT